MSRRPIIHNILSLSTVLNYGSLAGAGVQWMLVHTFFRLLVFANLLVYRCLCDLTSDLTILTELLCTIQRLPLYSYLVEIWLSVHFWFLSNLCSLILAYTSHKSAAPILYFPVKDQNYVQSTRVMGLETTTCLNTSHPLIPFRLIVTASI